MKFEIDSFHPTDAEKIDILKRLLKLARAGKIGPVYAYDSCRFETVVEIGTWAVEWRPLHICLERRRISWREALDLINTGGVKPEPVQRKPVVQTKRAILHRETITRRLAG